MSNSVVDMTVFLHRSKPLAIQVSMDEYSRKVWLPKSEIEIEDESIDHGPINITLPEWLAEEKELV